MQYTTFLWWLYVGKENGHWEGKSIGAGSIDAGQGAALWNDSRVGEQHIVCEYAEQHPFTYWLLLQIAD
jgi:hypothetical protein